MEKAAEVVADAATETMMATEKDEKTMTEGEWEYPPATRGLGQYQGQNPPVVATVRGTGVLMPWEFRQRDKGPS